MQYFMPKHVFLCRAGTQIVFLDLRKNKYSAIDCALESALSEVVAGWSTWSESPKRPSYTQGNNGSQVVKALISKGLLTDSPTNGKAATPVSVAEPAEDLICEYALEKPAINSVHISRFLLASMTASMMLRFLPLHRVVGRVRQSKHRGAQSSESFDISEARELVRVYEALRPFLFVGHDMCLFDSLAIFDFLRRYGLYPTWVIGVQTTPFAAHSWLQKEDVVLNDSLPHVNIYTPIMAI